jgi:UDP-glucose 4-epimerase
VKLLVTGGAGYIGSAVAALLLEAGHEVTILDDLSTGHGDALPAGATLVRGRVHDLAAEVVTAEAGFDGVVHCAAFIAAGESVGRPEKYWENNVIGSWRLLEAIRAAGVPRLVFSSTANVYGNPAEVPIPETAPVAPPNPYATSKLAVEYAITGECTAYGLAAVSLRYFNASGALVRPTGSYGERHDPETHLIPNALMVAAGQQEKLALFGDDYPTPDGTCVRRGAPACPRGRRPRRAPRLQPWQRHRVLQPGGRGGRAGGHRAPGPSGDRAAPPRRPRPPRRVVGEGPGRAGLAAGQAVTPRDHQRRLDLPPGHEHLPSIMTCSS